MVLERIFIVPPLAFARVGGSPIPCGAFLWGPNDISPRGAGSTTLVPALSLDVAEDGTLSSHIPTDVIFRDEAGIRPVCPFFELHAEWTDAAGVRHSGVVTTEVLEAVGSTLSDITWSVELGNLKAFHYTYEDGDRIEGRAEVGADNHMRTALAGASPGHAPSPLLRRDRGMPMGSIQAPKPSDNFPEICLRFYPPAGLVYGPEDLPERIAALDLEFQVGRERPNAEWRGFTLPAANLIVNPNASWPRYVPDAATLGPFFDRDFRNTPGGLLAAPFAPIPWLENEPILQRSLGLVDDVSDGLITCRVQLGTTRFDAVARIVVGPPDFAPANRPPVSLADNLTDRVDRNAARVPTGWTKAELGEIVLDILERAFESSELMHRDYQNFRSFRTNLAENADLGSRALFEAEDLAALLWPLQDPDLVIAGRVSAMTLSELGTRKHRRYAALEYLEDRFRENPAMFEQWIRRPVDPSPYFDKRMPALMRGSDGRPFHLTRRQWEIVRAWIAALRADTAAAGPAPAES